MKGMALLILILLGGCGTYTPLEQLEATAMLTGDWSEVEKRERIIARRELRSGTLCPSGTVNVCQPGAAGNRCTCMQSDMVRTLLGGR